MSERYDSPQQQKALQRLIRGFKVYDQAPEDSYVCTCSARSSELCANCQAVTEARDAIQELLPPEDLGRPIAPARAWNTANHCPRLLDVHSHVMIAAIHQGYLQLAAITRDPEQSWDNQSALAALADCLRQAGHPAFQKEE